jgi:phosphate transport system substrate-binding protein
VRARLARVGGGAFTRLGGVAVVLTVGLAALVIGGPAGAVSPALIQGSGSSWAENAVNQWVADVNSQGIQVVYNPDGDAQGRQDFANKVSDFSVTADGYQGFTSKNGTADTAQGRPYAYLPIAAGGTAFPYQIKVDGTQVKNLRLSGQTLAKIFTNQITNWDNSTITKDNNGVALPTLPIVPVVQSEGSGSTQQLTNYFATQFPSIWTPYAGQSGPTEYFPRQGSQIAQDGSNGAMNYVASSAGNGSIGYVEYSFALSVNYPVVKVLNKGGYYTLPTQYNVAVSLEAAKITTNPASPTYLLQTLDNVYTDTDSRTYPLSSYVYMIEPTGAYPSPESKVTTGKRQSIADFEYYGICQGQKQIGPIGYSPLPVNLVQAGFGQINKLKTAAPTINVTKETILNCTNPTFVEGQPNANYLATIAPLPPACDQTGAGPCASTVTPNGLGSNPTSSGSYGNSAASHPTSSAAGTTSGTSAGGATSAATSGTAIGGGTTSAAGGGAATATTTAGGASTAADCPTTTTSGETASATDCSNSQSTSGSSSSGSAAKYDSTVLPGYGISSLLARFGLLVVLLLLAVFAVPVVIGYRRHRKRREVGQ